MTGLNNAAMRMAGPGQQLVRLEAVIDPHFRAVGEGKAQPVAHRLQPRAIGCALLGRGPIFAGDMLGHRLTFDRHLRVQLERMPGDLRVNLLPHGSQRLFQLLIADDAPGADHVGNDVNAKGFGGSHCINTLSILARRAC